MINLHTTTPAKVEGQTVTVKINNDVESYFRTGIVSIDHGYAHLTVDSGQWHEYSLTLGGAHTPIEIR